MMKKNNYDMEPFRYKKPSDCEIVGGLLGNALNDLGNCMEAVVDKKEHKKGVVGSLLSASGNLLGAGILGTACAIKNTPRVIATVADTKRKIIDGVTDEYQNFQKEKKEDALDEKIKRLSGRNNKRSSEDAH